jgi:hypothetical protein
MSLFATIFLSNMWAKPYFVFCFVTIFFPFSRKFFFFSLHFKLLKEGPRDTLLC